MTIEEYSVIVIGVRKDTIKESSVFLKKHEALRRRISHYFSEVGLSHEDADSFLLMEDSDLEVLDYTNFYYHMKRERQYVDSGDPDLIETDPSDDRVLQFFKRNIIRTELFNCLFPREELKENEEEDKPVQLDNSRLVLLQCCLYY